MFVELSGEVFKVLKKEADGNVTSGMEKGKP